MTTGQQAAPGGFKTPDIATRVAQETAWHMACAKAGLAAAANARAGGTTRQLHDARKAVRVALNRIRADRGSTDNWTDDDVAAIVHGTSLIHQIEAMLDDAAADDASRSSADTWRDASGKVLNVLRSPEQIRAHYEARARASDASDEPIRLDEFLRGVANLGPHSPGVRNALSVGTDTAGGFSVPSIVMPAILEALVPASSVLMAGAGIVPLDSGAKTFTTAAVNAIPTAAWRSENGAVAESDPTFRGVVAAPQSLAFFFKVSRELLADSPNLQPALITAIAQAFAKELDRAALRGTGTPPQPRGLLNVAGIQSVTNGANGASLATTAYANLVSAVQSLLAADAPMPTAAIMAPRSLTTLGGLLDTTNQPRARPEMLAPMKFLSTSQIPVNLTVGTSTDCSEIYAGDFTKLAFMMREQMSVQVLNERFADNGQIGFVCHVRADVAVLYPAAFALITGVRA